MSEREYIYTTTMLERAMSVSFMSLLLTHVSAIIASALQGGIVFMLSLNGGKPHAERIDYFVSFAVFATAYYIFITTRTFSALRMRSQRSTEKLTECHSVIVGSHTPDGSTLELGSAHIRDREALP